MEKGQQDANTETYYNSQPLYACAIQHQARVTTPPSPTLLIKSVKLATAIHERASIFPLS